MGRRFESCRAHHKINNFRVLTPFVARNYLRILNVQVGQNQATTATMRTQNQNHSLRACLLCSTKKLSLRPTKRIKEKNGTDDSKLFSLE